MSKDQYTFTESLKSETILAVLIFFLYYLLSLEYYNLFYNFFFNKIIYLTIFIT